ncbi:MAG: AGE family epimerase/isomerase [Bacteroidales bacterium]|nr:AGE family epimerase/isomerase [Bacteroidales bacterium]
MNPVKTEKYIKIYKEGLLNDTVPFWIKHSVDKDYGGFMFSVDRDGSRLDTDKGMWQTCRFTWMLATLYNEVEQKEEWLDLALHGIDFINKHGFDSDGRMFFHLNRAGEAIRKRRYVFTETFASIAYAALYKSTGEEAHAQKSRELFQIVMKNFSSPDLSSPKFTSTRPMKGFSNPMISIVTAQELRKNLGDPDYTDQIDGFIAEIESDFMKPEFKAVLENVGVDGQFQDHFDGRLLCPGHAIEAAWFILNEAKIRNKDPELIRVGTSILDWMWEIGWDKEYGGILYFRDVKGLPVQEYWQDMKFWWPQNEAIIATLLAFQLTGESKYEKWHDMIHDWVYRYFPDPEHGEWYGYLHRDGRISVPLKGNLWKGPFHIPRMQLYAWQILEEIKAANSQS